MNWFKQTTFGIERGLMVIALVTMVAVAVVTVMAYEAIAG